MKAPAFIIPQPRLRSLVRESCNFQPKFPGNIVPYHYHYCKSHNHNQLTITAYYNTNISPCSSSPSLPFLQIMVVKIRLARFGPAKKPVYNIVVAQARSARGSKPMEVLGTYDPLPRSPLASNDAPDLVKDPQTGEMVPFKPKKYKDIKLDTSRTKYWLGVGAQPSEPVERMLCMVSLCLVL